MTNYLRGRIVRVYKYHAKFKRTGIYLDRYFINDTDEEINKQYELVWEDLTITPFEVFVDSVVGHHVDYEGTSISLRFTIDDKPNSVSINCEDDFEIIK